MTKLFSMKTLAFAGAAAFALTLVAAPKADAAVDNKLDQTDVEVNYSAGLLTICNVSDGTNGIDVTRTADGYGIYFGNGKTADKAKKSFIVTPDTNTATATATPSSIFYDISNLLGKKVNVAVATKADGSDAVTVELKESPKVKVTDIQDKILKAQRISDTQIYQYKVGTYGEWNEWYDGYDYSYDYDTQAEDNEVNSSNNGVDENLETAVARAKALGTTLYVRVANTEKVKVGEKEIERQSSPWSKEVKIKIKAKAKAPKVAVKTAKLTKAFEWNIAKYEYRLLVGDKTSPWVDGQKAGWKALIDKASTATAADKDVDLKEKVVTQLTADDVKGLVEGEAIASNITFQLRTKEDTSKKKDASQIAVVALEKSVDSPTKDQIAVKLETNTKKNATVSKAAISPKTVAGYTAQYSTDNTKWKALTKDITMDANKVGTLYLRLVGDGKDKAKASVLPSAVTKLTIPSDGKDGAKIKSEGFAISKDTGKWETVKYSDYENKTVDTAAKE